MTATAPAGLAAAGFRARHRDFDLHQIGGTYLAVPAGTPCHTGTSLSALARQISDHRPPAGRPAPGDAARIAAVLASHPHWSVFWDTRHRLWRAAEDDPGSDLYAASPDAGVVITYIAAHT